MSSRASHADKLRAAVMRAQPALSFRVFIATLSESADGGAMQKALVARGLLEEIEEPVPGRKDRTRNILKPTPAGRAFVKERQDAAESLDAGSGGTGEAPGAVSEAQAEEPGESILGDLGEINF